MTSKDACILLGLNGPVGGADLTAAFRRAAKAARPDQSGGDEDRFRQVIEAYRLLQALEAARTTMPARPASQPKPATETPCPPPSVLEISPREAMLGVSRRVEITSGRTLGLRLPAGLRTGETVRLGGKADDGSDLMLTVKVRPDAGMRIIGDDLWLECQVDPSLLSHGGRFTVVSPRGEHAVTAPPALPAPYRLRLKDQGLPARAGKAQGHLFVTLKPLAATAPDPVRERLGRFKRAWMRG
ncbi:DnaJ C-terminal domain-containing protein [Brevundimonas aveniformis]|uniref:DnaJ C-terminal domain-containing protein n=1 Tax=Brevundimonas aveniformis TaxID=370977 RepID=UPI00248FE1AF|nr:DnaJ C-terminal domain-containing protein [Brevundimonas aveniformis]